MSQLSIIRLGASSLLVSAACLLGSVPRAHAQVTLCNSTARSVFVTYRAPAANCATGSKQDHILMSAGACTTLGNGSANGKSFYYFAVDQNDPNVFWAGDQGIYVPDVTVMDRSRCTPALSCHPSSGASCAGGQVYGMREYVGSEDSYTYTLEE
jgi:uncharacterized membrane protein